MELPERERIRLPGGRVLRLTGRLPPVPITGRSRRLVYETRDHVRVAASIEEAWEWEPTLRVSVSRHIGGFAGRPTQADLDAVLSAFFPAGSAIARLYPHETGLISMQFVLVPPGALLRPNMELHRAADSG